MGAVTDYLVCKDKLFMLWEKKDILKCYELTGTYLYSYSFPHIQKGASTLHTDGESVFLEDRVHNYYVFSADSEFEEYIDGEEKKAKIKERFLDKKSEKIAQNGDSYQLPWNSVVRVSKTGAKETIISWPFWMGFFIKSCFWFITFLLMILIIIREGIKGNLKFCWRYKKQKFTK